MKAGGAALAGALLFTAASATARPIRPVVISKRVDPMVRYVSYADLSLKSHQDRKILTQRVYGAVDEVCPAIRQTDPSGDTGDYDRRDCRESAWAVARPQIQKAIRSVSFGPQLVMAIAVSSAPR
jgi:UrcA family protein